MEMLYFDKYNNPYSVFIDFDDLELINKYKWIVTNKHGNGTQYVKSGRISMHRLIMSQKHNITGIEIDHINRNGLDNRKINLRLSTSQNNKRNRANFGKIKYIGVYEENNRFIASIKPDIHINQVILGVYKNPVAAAKIYDICALQYFKEFANLNFPEYKCEYINFINANLSWFDTPHLLRKFFSSNQIQNKHIENAILDTLVNHDKLSTVDIVKLTGYDKAKITRIAKRLVLDNKIFQINDCNMFYYSFNQFAQIPKHRKYSIGTIVKILTHRDQSFCNRMGTVIGYENNKIKIDINGTILLKYNSAICLP